MRKRRLAARLVGIWLACASGEALAQRSGENAVTSASDAFGTSVGNESIGLYSASDVRGFSPAAAGNMRVEGLYFGGLTIWNHRLLASSSVKVGLSAQGYPFPAPTGIIDFALRPAGSEPALSAVAYAGVQDGLDLDAQLPVTKRLSLAGGVSFNRNIDAPGGDYANLYELAVAPSWRPAKNSEVRAYYGIYYAPKDVSTPQVFLAEAKLPPRLPSRSLSQSWAGWNNRFFDLGLFGHGAVGEWRLSGGLFRQVYEGRRSFNTLFVDARADGSARFVTAVHPPRKTATSTGEISLSRRFEDGSRLHELLLSLKGRAQTSDFGGEQVVDFGAVTLGERPPVFPRPVVEFGAESSDRTRHFTAGLGYHGIWRGRGEISLGLQKARYRKTVTVPGEAPIETRDDPWLWNGTLAVDLTSRLVAYAGYTRGLEDSAVAPAIAVNRSEPPPALRTSQRDFGLRLVFGTMRLIVGGFDVRKPYFNLDASHRYAQLGTIRHRGVEISLAGEPVPGLNVVAGAVLMKPRVEGAAVDLGLIGSRPVGQAGRSLTAYADYRLPFAGAVSVSLGLQHLGRRPGSLDDLLTVSGRTIVDLGGRYRFKLGEFPATLRLQLTNVLDTYAWDVDGYAGFRRAEPRRATLTLSVDA